MSRVGLLGGSFNPPHVGHQMLALWALGGAWVDEVWLLPCDEHAFGKVLAPFTLRLEMCEALVGVFAPGRVGVCSVEGDIPGPSRTYETMRVLREKHPEHDFSLLMGADLLDELPRWYRGDDLVRETSLLVAGRAGASAAAQAVAHDGRHRVFPEVELVAVSSTAIRRAVRNSEDVTAVVPRLVVDIISREGLYTDETQ